MAAKNFMQSICPSKKKSRRKYSEVRKAIGYYINYHETVLMLIKTKIPTIINKTISIKKINYTGSFSFYLAKFKRFYHEKLQ